MAFIVFLCIGGLPQSKKADLFSHFRAHFSSVKDVGGTLALIGLEILHGQQQSQIVLLFPRKNVTKQGLRC